MIKAADYKNNSPKLEALAKMMGVEWNGKDWIKKEKRTYTKKTVSLVPKSVVSKIVPTKTRKKYARFVPTVWEDIKLLGVGAVLDITDVVKAAKVPFEAAVHRVSVWSSLERKADRSFDSHYTVLRTGYRINVHRFK